MSSNYQKWKEHTILLKNSIKILLKLVVLRVFYQGEKKSKKVVTNPNDPPPKL